MSLEIMRDPRVRSVEWRDLTRLSGRETAAELLLSAPWLCLSLVLADAAIWPAALGASFVFFLTGLRQVHNAYHNALGIPRAACDGVMFLLSVLMLGSMHAVQFNHLRHHRHCMDDEDVEAMTARMSAGRALLTGPLFPFALHRKALSCARGSMSAWIWAELAANLAWVIAVFAVLDVAALRYHVIAMAAGQCLTGFFCVWTVHHDCDRRHFIARTMRGRLLNRLSFGMFLHTEHHLFPAVPTCKLTILAARLDRAAPELQVRRVF